jgi:hypothetical protein
MIYSPRDLVRISHSPHEGVRILAPLSVQSNPIISTAFEHNFMGFLGDIRRLLIGKKSIVFYIQNMTIFLLSNRFFCRIMHVN